MKDPGRMTANRKPTAAVLYVPAIFFEADRPFRANEDIDAARGTFVIDRAEDAIDMSQDVLLSVAGPCLGTGGATGHSTVI